MIRLNWTRLLACLEFKRKKLRIMSCSRNFILLVVGLLIIDFCGGIEVSAAAQDQAAKNAASRDTTKAFWLETSLKRVFPKSPVGRKTLELLAARNGRVSFQACFRNGSNHPFEVECKILGAEDLKPQVRFVGLLPMMHLTPNTDTKEIEGLDFLPGLVPDPLWPKTKAQGDPSESRSFWVTLHIPADAKPGVREFNVQFNYDGNKQVTLPIQIEVSSLVVQPRHDFEVTHWWRGEATWDYYKTGMFDERWWKITRDQLADMLDHGSDVVYAPIFFNRRETFKRPCQLLIVNETKPGHYEFDWSQVKRFTDMCKEIGFRKFEWSHIWIYWGVKNPIRVYTKKDDAYVMLWPPDTGATSDTYVNFLKQFLPEFHTFLENEKILEDSYFHLSDEPGSAEQVENYRKARKVLRDLAPWMKVMDALSDVRYGKEGLTDMPVPSVGAAQAYLDAKIPHWVYYCCNPQGPWLNRFMDTPLPKVRMSGWLFYRLHAEGFLHWGFNYWHKLEREELTDPFNDASAALYPNIPYGDPFMIYPGPDEKPIDSLRWEVFSESLQDYAILQTAGIKPDDALFSDIKSYADFPKNEEWIQNALAKILKDPHLSTKSATTEKKESASSQ
jgi:Glycoside hydrolase 123, catalytic domain